MATLRDVALKANVSITTASFVLNNRAKEMRISKATIKRVYRAAEELKYTGNYHARALLRGRTQTLGLIMPPMQQHMVFMLLYEGLMTEARGREYDMLQITDNAAVSAIQRGIRYIRERRIDGLISFTPPPNNTVENIIRDRLPICCIYLDRPGPCAHVTIDPEPGIRAAVQHLAEQGHRNVLWILRTGSGGAIFAPERFDIGRDEAARQNIRPHFLTLPPPPRSTTDAYDFISYYFDSLSQNLPENFKSTAVCCYNDKMASALCMVLRQRGLNVPGDISVIGYDNTIARQIVPPLTTINPHYYKLGTEAVRDVVDQFENYPRRRGRENMVLSTELIIRNSTGPV